MPTVNEIRDDLLDRLDKPVLDDYDQARYALAARDAYWDGVRDVIIDGEPASDSYAEFFDWQHQLTGDKWPYNQDVRRTLSEQVLNASHPQIREYDAYLKATTATQLGAPVWPGAVQVRYQAQGPYDDMGLVYVTHVLADGHYDAEQHVADDDDDLEAAVRVGWLQAFESMIPMSLETEWGTRVVWQPWVDANGDPPGLVAEALERLHLGTRLSDVHTTKLGRLVGPVGLAVVLFDPDMDRTFWAGEWADEFLRRAPERRLGEAVLARRAPELFDAMGGND